MLTPGSLSRLLAPEMLSVFWKEDEQDIIGKINFLETKGKFMWTIGQQIYSR